MSTYLYRSKDGKTIEVDRPIGKAPQRIRKNGKTFNRVITMPVVRQLSALDRGDRPSICHQLPAYYGYGQREQCWKERMEQLGVEDTPHRRMQVTKAKLGPNPRYIEQRSREAAAKAGALDGFDKKGRPIARTKRGVGLHLETAKRIGDDLKWD